MEHVDLDRWWVRRCDMRTLKHQRIPDCIEIDPVSVVEASVYDKDMRLKHAALADAQATIAALQAERDEYKTMYACT